LGTRKNEEKKEFHRTKAEFLFNPFEKGEPKMKWPVSLVFGLGCVLGTLLAAEDTKKFSYVDLQPKANQKLVDNFGSGIEGNNLANVPKGEQTFEEVKFKIAEGCVQLGSERLKETKPDRVDGIPVGKPFAKLHLLHATEYGAGETVVSDDTEIARYDVHYEGGDTEKIPVVYGKDVRDWWIWGDEPAATRGKVAWTGENESSKDAGHQIRLFLGTWENPHPTKRVVSIDYVKVGDSVTAPFCVAMTLEEK
jgi:hypothetical protein